MQFSHLINNNSRELSKCIFRKGGNLFNYVSDFNVHLTAMIMITVTMTMMSHEYEIVILTINGIDFYYQCHYQHQYPFYISEIKS